MSNKNGSKWIRPEKRLAIYLRDGFGCVYCYRDLGDAAKSEVSLDHLIPRSEGGDNHQTNLITACTPCNSSRQDRTLVQWAVQQDWTVEKIKAVEARIGHAVTQPLNMDLAKSILSGEVPEVEQSDPDCVADAEDDITSTYHD